MTELACQQVVELVTSYLEDALTPEDRVRFRTHLAACAGCDAYLEQMKETISATGGLARTGLDPTMRDRLVEAFRTWGPPQR